MILAFSLVSAMLAGMAELVASQSDASLALAQARLETYMHQPKPESMLWRKKVSGLLPILEHAASPSVGAAWRLLAHSNADADRANYILFLRRHGYDLPTVGPQILTGSEETLERALAMWGSNDLAATQHLLEAAVLRFPLDGRFRQNLLWLLPDQHERFSLRDDPRASALSVLAARRAFR
ncbi:MAG: hypothetical protein HOM34_09180 [Planctomycetes bacterium]|nr:hypothetical protein [Planctomycetota bacterium]MBT5120880.1 hypothetical protein [Planctomycetota bacterium]MBT7319506.1 hypothetical protein [Planctomycetota bacterium]